MAHSKEFLKDEVRNGFYIPTAVKQAWAETLDVLAEIDRICRKYDIRYFADWGTFLGAVRHGGFVPWDDDLDICMLRDDYVRFRQVADYELPSQFMIHDYQSKKDHWLFLSRVVNNSTMCFEEEYLDKHNNFLWLTGVDIFIKDYLYPDDEDEVARDKEILNILAFADGIIDGSLSKQTVDVGIDDLQKKYSVEIPKQCDDHEKAVALYRLAEQQMARVKSEDSDRVGQLFPWVIKRGPEIAEAKETYENMILLPFEDTVIPVPAAYNRSLTSRYGNTFCQIRKVWGGHDYPFFEGQKAEMERLSGERFPGFYFDRSMLTRSSHDRSASLKVTAEECLKELEAMLSDAEEALRDGDWDEFTGLISDSQQLAADLGTLIEHTKGEDAAATIRITGALQAYCDALWEEYQSVADSKAMIEMAASHAALKKAAEVIKTDLIDRREILFLTTGPKEWKGMEKYFEKISGDNADIFVVPLPLMRKRFTGVVMTDEDEGEVDSNRYEDYPSGIAYTDYRTYDPSIHCPDEVYVQYPYDGANPCFTIPADFYVRNLQKYSEKIIFIPAYKTGEFGPEDRNDLCNLKHYAASPGVVFADEVIVQSENIRERYVEALCEFAGEDTRELWLDKIHPEDDPIKEAEKNSKKKLLFCVGLNELAEYKEDILDAIRRKADTMEEAKEKIEYYLSVYPNEKNEWLKTDPSLAGKVFNELERLVSEGRFEKVTYDISDADEIAPGFDAYYGSPSPFVPAFITHGKPVMIADFDM